MLNELDGPLLVAVAKRTGTGFEVVPNPSRSLRVEADDEIIVISNGEQQGRLEHRFKLTQGR